MLASNAVWIQCSCGLWLLHNGIPARFRAIGPPVNGGIGRIDALFFFCECPHVKCHRQKTVTIRPAKQQKVKAPDSSMDHMVIDKRKQFHFFALSPGNDRIIQYKALYFVPAGERAEICRSPSGKQQHKLFPVVMAIGKETVVCALRTGSILLF